MNNHITAMEKQSSRFYDIRFGILIAIIISILLFKYFSSQPLKTAPAPPFSSSSSIQKVDDPITPSALRSRDTALL